MDRKSAFGPCTGKDITFLTDLDPDPEGDNVDFKTNQWYKPEKLELEPRYLEDSEKGTAVEPGSNPPNPKICNRKLARANITARAASRAGSIIVQVLETTTEGLAHFHRKITPLFLESVGILQRG